MYQNGFENEYHKKLGLMYGEKRNFDEDQSLLSTNNYPHDMSVTDRIDFTSLEVYSVDPQNCSDADDAFSIYEQDQHLYLAIHVADPTYYVELNSALWFDILHKNVSKYPSNSKPIHLMPQEILEVSSLCENSQGNIKKAISIVIEINNQTFEPKNNITMYFSTIRVKKENALTYKQASELYKTNRVFFIGQKINENLQNRRSLHTLGTKLNQLSYAYPVYDEQGAHLYQDSSDEKNLKQMIAEFAILANSYVGEYLNIALQGEGIFRSCNVKEWLNTLNFDIKGEDLISKIIDNGISASYLSTIDSHDLVGSDEYTHFTSPIRRVSDCICHYLLKYIYLQSQNICVAKPFTYMFLKDISEKCARVTKKFKKIQYNDTKFRLIQSMSNMLSKNTYVALTYRIISYSGLFINILISKIDDLNIHLSYTLRENATKYINYSKENQTINITQVNCPDKYDEGSIPELDAEIFTIFRS